MQMNPYLMFQGECEQAFRFYERLLGGKIEFSMTYGESPAKVEAAPEWGNKILHASMRIGDQRLLGSDPPPDHYEPPRGFQLCLGAKDVPEAEKLFRDLSEGGQIKMPLQKTFWAEAFGMLVDRYGIPWMVNCESH